MASYSEDYWQGKPPAHHFAPVIPHMPGPEAVTAPDDDLSPAKPIWTRLMAAVRGILNTKRTA